MGHRLFDAFRVQRHLSDCQRFRHFHKIADTDNGSVRRRFPHEVDVQVCCDNKGDDTDLAKNCHIKRDVSDGHEHRTGHGSAWAEFVGADLKFYCCRSASNCLNGAIGMGILRVKEFNDLCLGDHTLLS